MTMYLNNISAAWWAWIAPLSIQVAVLAAFVWLIDLLLRKRGWPQVRYALWALVFVRLLLPPSFALPTSVAAWLLPPAQITAPAPAALPVHVADVPVAPLPQYLPPAPPTALPHVVPSAAAHTAATAPAMSWETLAFLFWLCGIAAITAYVGIRVFRFSRSVSASAAPLPPTLDSAMKRAAVRLRMRSLPRVVLTDAVRGAAAFGVLRPVLLVPTSAASLSAESAEHIFLHEIAHVKRGDLIVNAAQTMLFVMFWFNPFIWLAARALRRLRELCCDATVAAHLREKTAHYRQTLLSEARRILMLDRKFGLGLLGLFESPASLAARLDHLTRPSWNHRRLRAAVTVLAVAVTFLFVVPMARVAAAPQEPAPAEAAPAAKTASEETTQTLTGRVLEKGTGKPFPRKNVVPCFVSYEHAGYKSMRADVDELGYFSALLAPGNYEVTCTLKNPEAGELELGMKLGDVRKIELKPGEDLDIGVMEVPPPPAPETLGSVKGRVKPLEDGIELARIAVSAHKYEGKAVARATETKADGTFTFDGLDPGRYQVDVSETPVQSVAGVEIRIVTVAAGRSSDIELDICRGSLVTGRVLDKATGGPVTGHSTGILAKRNLPEKGRVGYAANSNPEDGRYSKRLAPGTYEVWPYCNWLDTVKSLKRDLVLTSGTDVELDDFLVSPVDTDQPEPEIPGGLPSSPETSATQPPAVETAVEETTQTLTGSVLDTNGRPAAGLVVTAYARHVDGESIVSAKTGPDGKFSFAVPVRKDSASAYTLIAQAKNALAVEYTRSENARPFDEVTLQLLRADAAISGKVTDTAGIPLAAVNVSVASLSKAPKDRMKAEWDRYYFESFPAIAAFTAVTDAKGDFTIHSLPRGHVALLKFSNDTGIARAEFVAGGQPLTVTLVPAGSLLVRITSKDPSLTGAAVPLFLSPLDFTTGGGTQRIVTGEDGTVLIDHLAPGKYQANIDPSLEKTLSEITRSSAVVESGKIAEVTIEAVRGSHISGRIVEKGTGKPFPEDTVTPHFMRGGQGMGGDPDAQGYFSTLLAPGKYDVSWVRRNRESGESEFGNLQGDVRKVELKPGEDLDIGVMKVPPPAAPPAPGSLGSIKGRVKPLEDGIELAGVPVRVQKVEGKKVFRSTETRADGTFTESGLDPGRYQVSAFGAADQPVVGVGSLSVTVTAGKTSDAEVSVIRGSLVTARVLDKATGEPLADRRFGVSLSRRISESKSHGYMSGGDASDGRGSVRLPPGNYEVYPFYTDKYGLTVYVRSLKREVTLVSGADVEVPDFLVSPVDTDKPEPGMPGANIRFE